MSWSEDPSFIQSNSSPLSTLHPGGLEWGAYLDLFGEKEWKDSMAGFAGDLFKNAPELMAGSEGEWWYPTMNLHLQYFSRFVPLPASLPSLCIGSWADVVYRVDPKDERYSKTKVFLYAKGSFLEAGRHDCVVEVWSAPSTEAEKRETWREEQVCLARCTQFAWALPVSCSLIGRERCMLMFE